MTSFSTEKRGVLGLEDRTSGGGTMLLDKISRVSHVGLLRWHKYQQQLRQRWQSIDTTGWQFLLSRTRFFRLIGAAVALLFLYLWSHQSTPYQPTFPTADISILSFNTTHRLPQIPPKIWQIYFDFSAGELSQYIMPIHSWISNSPSHAYTILDQQGALAILSKLRNDPKRAHILPAFYAMPRRVLRADFLRYLLLAIEGGVYSDIDTELLQPIHDWVPDEYKTRTKLIVGLEADSSPPVAGTTYEVQFCQWTLAGSADHPALWMMVNRILEEVSMRPFHDPPLGIDYSNDEVLDITGPAGWTETIFKYLDTILEEPVTWRNLTGMTRPKLFGDVLILPINGFATGVPHSGASKDVAEDSFVKHQFVGAWRDGT